MKIGILGAGQLGRMLALAGYPLGLEFLFVDPMADSPASHLAEHIVADYDDPQALKRLATECDVVSYEFENVPEAAANGLGSCALHPNAKALAVSQDRWHEKSCFRELGIDTAPFANVTNLEELQAAVDQLGVPCLLKTRRFGYDGKGQRRILHREQAAQAYRELGEVPCLLEGLVPFDREVSLIAIRSTRGELAFYPLIENHHRDGILRLSLAPAPRLTPELQAAAEAFGRRLLERLDYVGVLTLELFVVGEQLIANEFAPRVHNSGHLTIEGAVTSQFENHLRAICGWPLGATQLNGAVAMLNLVGALPEASDAAAHPGLHLHYYGKQPRPARKVGHLTLVAATEEERAGRLRAVEPLLLACDAFPAGLLDS